MSDITKCGGFDCPMKQACKRYTAPANEYRQSYFLDHPYKIDEKGFSCDMYWGENAQSAWDTLQEAVGITIPKLEKNYDFNDHKL
jgi:hypothetical protein